MNEQIKQLWNKAADSTASLPSGQNNSWETQVNFIEKFAELIVKECGGIYDKIDNGNDHMGTNNYLLALQRHFEIKQ